MKRIVLFAAATGVVSVFGGCAWTGAKATGLDDPSIVAPSSGLGQQPLAANEPTGVSGWFWSTGEAISDALTIEETVIPAQDGVDLNSKPTITPELHLAQGQLLERKGDLDAAIARYEQALKIDGKHAPTKLALARALDRRGKPQEAEARYREAVVDAPQDPKVFNDLGLFLARKGNLAGAREALENSVRLEAKSPLYRNNLAAVWVELGEPVKAAETLEPVFGKAVASYNVAYLLKQRGQIAPAREWSLHATRLDPTMAPAQALFAETDQALRVAGAAPAGPSQPTRR